ncbi:uncharacterized protein [Lolium perenne]|uniref:uncharacterized protein n=1 Tax=Lolium perenne TaxID=4522 RepID=UPI0021F62D8E|nr:uncharacterized protein LOC127322006 [Lolium perenne]
MWRPSILDERDGSLFEVKDRELHSVSAGFVALLKLFLFRGSRCRNKNSYQQSEPFLWASLHVDALELIGDRVLAGDLLDYIWFRASCKHWRASTPCPLGCGLVDPRFQPRQWTMFPEGSGLHPGHPAFGGYIRVLNIYLASTPCSTSCPGSLLLLQRNKDAEFPHLASLCLYMSKFGIFLIGPYDLRLRMAHAAVSIDAGGTITVMLAPSHLERMVYASSGGPRN